VAYDVTNRQWVPDPVVPFTGRVVRIDGDGAWVAALGEDESTPIGGCRGGGAGLTVGRVVLVVETADGPWIAGVA
jgi:hypothetical protein